jgi:hypothetical protein
MFIRVQSIEPLTEQVVWVVFTNGERRDIDLTPSIADGPMFEPVRNNPAFFRSAYVEGGTIAWPNGAAMDPDVLYSNGPSPWAREQTVSAHDQSR